MTKLLTLSVLANLWDTTADDLDLVDPDSNLELEVRSGIGTLYELRPTAVGHDRRHLLDLDNSDTNDLLVALA